MSDNQQPFPLETLYLHSAGDISDLLKVTPDDRLKLIEVFYERPENKDKARFKPDATALTAELERDLREIGIENAAEKSKAVISFILAGAIEIKNQVDFSKARAKDFRKLYALMKPYIERLNTPWLDRTLKEIEESAKKHEAIDKNRDKKKERAALSYYISHPQFEYLIKQSCHLIKESGITDEKKAAKKLRKILKENGIRITISLRTIQKYLENDIPPNFWPGN